LDGNPAATARGSVTDPNKAVFLSYASQDAEAAQSLCSALRASGIEVWFDQSELRGGDVWDASIRRQIKSCALFIPVISKNTHTRGEGYFRLEWKLAVDRSHLMASDLPFLLPVVVDDTPDQEDRVPDRFREVQWTRLPGGANADAFVDHVRRLLASDVTISAATIVKPSAVPASSAGTASTRSTPRASRSFVPWIVGGLVILAVSYFAAEKFVASKHAVPAAAVPISDAIPEKSIAVLPFVDMSEKHDQDYFADGMAEEILDLLAKIPGLTVIGRTSSFQFKGKNEDLRTIGTKLNAAYVLEGSVRTSINRVRVTAQLIDTRTGAHQWSESYDRDLGDVLKLQDDIARAVTQALRIVLTAPLPARPSLKSSEAYRMYLQGVFFSYARTQVDSKRALSAYRTALTLDPQYSPAWAALSNELQNQSDWLGEDARSMYAAARDAAQRAITLDPAAIHGYLAMANVLMYFDWDWARAGEAIETARRLQPDSPRVLRMASALAAILGHWDEAIGYAREAIARDTLSASAHDTLGFPLYCKGEFAESENEYRTSLELSPGGGTTYSLLSQTLMLQGRLTEALTAARKDTNEEFRLLMLAIILHRMGRQADSDAALAELKRKYPSGDEGGIAWAYAARGELDSAAAWFERAYTQRDLSLTFLKCMADAPKFVRDPRYKALLRKMNLPD
jgi:TolB-like protein/Tfp pilus assembly protein PilF